MTNFKPASTPLMSHYKLNDEQSLKIIKEQCYMYNIPYANIGGYVMYVMVCTSRNITFEN